MKIKFLTILCLFALPLFLMGQSGTGTGGNIPATGTSGVTNFVATVTGGVATTVNNPCPEAAAATLDIPATVGYNYDITDVTITGITHTFGSDLEISLLAPDGTEFFLTINNGGSTGLDAGLDMVFDMAATDCVDSWTSSTSTVQPNNGVLPETSENNCMALTATPSFTCGINSGSVAGPPVNGDWTLVVNDEFGGDTGSFTDWTINFAAITPALDVETELAACCVSACELTGATVINEALEPGECEEAVFFDDPTLLGDGCQFCPDPVGVMPGNVVSQTGNATFDEVLDADGNLSEVNLGAGTGASGEIIYEIVAPVDGDMSFDWAYQNGESPFWDPFIITGPAGTIASFTGFTGATNATGSVCETVVAGDAFTFDLSTLDGAGGGEAMAQITNIAMVQDVGPCYSLEQVGGPMSGDYLAPGTYTVMWEATPQIVMDCMTMDDPGGDVLTFETDLVVIPYSGPISTALACNDLVNISLDENCEVTISADMFLEGGPYGCYDDYVVTLNDDPTDVNGLTLQLPLGSHTVTVTDPNTGNSCWGDILVEDKLATPINCTDFSVTCIGDIPAAPEVFDVSELPMSATFPVTQAATTTYQMVAPGSFTVTDLNLDMDIAFGGFDESIEIIAPSGFSYLMWPQTLSGCPTLDLTADNQGITAGNACATLNTGENVDLVSTFAGIGAAFVGFGDMSMFNGEQGGGLWQITVTGSGTINDLTLEFNNGVGLLITNPLPQDACGNSELVFSDQVIPGGCTGGIERQIVRTWQLTDASGNSSSCTQVIDVINITADALTLPPTLVELPCNAGTSPEEIATFFDDPTTRDNVNTSIVENHEGYPWAYPTYEQGGHPQKVDTEVCKLIASYSDQELSACGGVCGGNKKVIRTWTILDWCNLTQAEHVQVIKAVDQEGPTFTALDFEVSTNPWGCEADVDIPHPWELHDNCDTDPTYYVTGPVGTTALCPGCPGNEGNDKWVLLGAPKGVHNVTYNAVDCCGNTTSQTVLLTVADKTAPVASAFQNLVVSLTSSGTNNDGLAKLYAHQVNNGSHDGCSEVHIEIRRDSDNCDIRGNATYNADGHPQDGSPNPTSPNYDPDNGEHVKFCCADLTEIDPETGRPYGIVKVWLRVWDDGNMSGAYGDVVNGQSDNYNETWANVRVDDKLAPAIVCPPDVVLTCDMDYTDLSMTGEAEAFGTCAGIAVEYRDLVVNLDACGAGFVIRRWNIEGNTSLFCDQRIDLTALAPFDGNINWPRDREVDGCPDEVDGGEPGWTAGPCDVIGYTVESDTFDFEDGACFKILNHFTVIDWCQYEPNAPGWNGEGLYEHTQVIKVFDDTRPEILDCDDKMFSLDANCEHVLTLTNSANDPGSENCPTSWLKWQVLVDTWADGTIDYEFSSFLPSNDSQFNDTNGNGIPDIYVAATANDGEISITVPEVISGNMSNHKVEWYVTDGCGNNRSCKYDIMVVDKKAPTPYCINISSAVMENGMVELWASDFNVNSFDNCTAQEDLLYTFDELAPQITDTIIQNRLLNVGVSHYFNANGFVDWNGDGGAYPVAKASTIAAYNNGELQLWMPELQTSGMVYTCDDFPQAEVHMTVWDEKLNSDFCVVYLTLADNQGACDPTGGSRVSGNISTEVGTPLSGANVYVDAVMPEYPKATTTNASGDYAFNNLANGNDFQLSAANDIDYKNGVSTLDLVLIQRHILGLTNLDSPYKLIAADINNSESITASDLTQLRKLILGLYVNDDLPDNESWRFVVEGSSMDASNPWPFVELNDISGLSSNRDSENFVAVKIGDVNGSVELNAKGGDSEVRSSRVINLQSEDREVEAGEEVRLVLSSGDFADVYGYQFTMNLEGMIYGGVESGLLDIASSNVGVISSDQITMSWNSRESVSSLDGESLFTIVLVAERSGRLSDMVGISSDVTRAEVYTGDNLSVGGIELNLTGTTEVEASYALGQNEPNPFSGNTEIVYSLPESSSAVFTVYDVTGKVVMERELRGERGVNVIRVEEKSLNGAGVYYYQLSSGDYTATRKMIVIE